MPAHDFIRFAWWNTGFAPPYVAKNADSRFEQQIPVVVKRIIETEECSLLALGEVRAQQPIDWVPVGQREYWKQLVDPSSERDAFDVAILYDTRVLEIVDHYLAIEYRTGSKVRAGLIGCFSTVEHEQLLVFVASHWRSDTGGNTQDSKEKRDASAERLRHALSDFHGDRILVLGDLNAEPHERPLQILRTTRVRHVAATYETSADCRHDILLYNASWRFLGEKFPFGKMFDEPTLAGTYKLPGNRPTNWRTFDQVLVSGPLLRGVGWTLREDMVSVDSEDDVYDPVKQQPRKPFDHLPILAMLQWRKPHDG